METCIGVELRKQQELEKTEEIFIIMLIFKGSRIYKITFKKIRLLVAMCFAFFKLILLIQVIHLTR